MADDQSIQVYVRVRWAPDDATRRKCITVNSDRGTLTLHTPGDSEDRAFAFDKVGGESTSQDEVFSQVGRPLSEMCMNGYNVTIFACASPGSEPGALMIPEWRPIQSMVDPRTSGRNAVWDRRPDGGRQNLHHVRGWRIRCSSGADARANTTRARPSLCLDGP